MELDEKFKIKAFAELREDDLRKRQALEQFREWIAKQGHIKNCRTGSSLMCDCVILDLQHNAISDDSFLLRFLRVKKYSNAEAFKIFEKYLVSCETYPQWFRHLTLDDDRMRQIYESGYIFPLKERDQNGCRVILIQACKLDVKKFTFSDVLKVINLVIFTLLEEAETQVSGFVYIIDHKGIGMEYHKIFSIIDMKNYLRCIQNAIPCRQKQGLWLNLPGFAVTLTDIAKSFVSPKLRERAYFYKDSEKVLQHVDVKILPLEYGGVLPISDMMESFKAIMERYKRNLRELDDQRIDLSAVKNHEADAADSFRKLEIDWEYF